MSSPTLQQHLDRSYAQTVGYQHPALPKGVSARNEFRAAINADEVLRTEAQERRKSLVDSITDRCYQSRVYRTVLDSVLGG